VSGEPVIPSGVPEIEVATHGARRFEDRVCVVSGAASGIGAAVVARLASEGARIVAADIDLVGTRAVVRAHVPRGRGVAVRVDVRSERSVARLVAATERRFGIVDVLINNAGIEIQGNALEVTPDQWDEVMAVNLRGTYLVSRAFLPLLLTRAAATGEASIVNTASLMGLVSSQRLTAYCASKAGVVSLSRSMALDHARSGLRVNCVCPGIIHTPMLERRFGEWDDRAIAYRETSGRPPVGYIGRADDVAAAIAYLASPEARFVTGSALTIDGGVGAQ
jgi:NAD(P)-dependent dehydrogenase (short-subunit alcohol dehydrogenase family)